ncbi:DUF6233 domain-containing protein [Streptomyces sp. NPDC004267]|uniref:DUF6233 domain-containing protein n=1 Tax=Streptomyces sp. NPDC004267 TaxID=3364694 RepID=UPI003678D0A6
MVVLPDGQELRARLYSWHQTPTGWQGDVGLPSYRNREDHSVEAAEYRVWLDAPQHLHPIPGVDYSSVPATRLPKPSFVEELLGERRPSGWVMQGLERGRGVLHAPDCAEAPDKAVPLSLDRALNLAEQPGVRLCSLCGAAQELDPVLRGFGAGFDERSVGERGADGSEPETSS